MHPYILQMVAEARAADMQTTASQSRLAAQARPHRSRPGLRALFHPRHIRALVRKLAAS